MLKRVLALAGRGGDSPAAVSASLLKRQRLLARISPLVPYLRSALLLGGFLYLLALPTQQLGRGHYVSENALQPSQVRPPALPPRAASAHPRRVFPRSTPTGTGQTCTSQTSMPRTLQNGPTPTQTRTRSSLSRCQGLAAPGLSSDLQSRRRNSGRVHSSWTAFGNSVLQFSTVIFE